jgi:hypothetical protein
MAQVSETIRVVVTGANPSTKTFNVLVDTVTGAGVSNPLSISEVGVNAGSDVVQAFMDSHSLSSNVADVNWQATNGLIALGPVTATSYGNAGQVPGWAGFGGGLNGTITPNSLVINQVIQNYPINGFNSQPTNIGPGGGYKLIPARFVNQTTSGTFANVIFIPGSGNVGDSHGQPFICDMTGYFIVKTPGIYTFYMVFANVSQCAIWVGGGAISVYNGGNNTGANPFPATGPNTTFWNAQSPSTNHLMCANNVNPGLYGGTRTCYINFPTAGKYPYETIYNQRNPISFSGDNNGYFQFTYLQGQGAQVNNEGANGSGPTFLPVSIATAPAVGPTPTGSLRLTPTGGSAGLLTQGQTDTLSLNIVNVPYVSIPYIPLWEGTAGALFLYDNASVFNFGGATYPPVGGVVPDYTSALAAGAINISGDNSAWQGVLSLTANGTAPSGSLSLSYNGGATVSHTDITNLTITADDIAWFDATGTKYDLFTASAGGGGLQYPIQIAYMVKPVQAGVTVSPTSIAADGGNHTLTVTLPKPISPEQQGLFGTGNTITASASASNGVTIVTQPAAILDSGGWLLGWSVVVHVPISSTNSSFQLSMSVTGTLTYLSGTTFVTNGAVTYLSGAVGSTITTTGSGYLPPSNYSFAVTGAISGTAPNYSINGTITMTAVISATDNGAMTPVTFYRVLNGVRTNIGNGTVGSPVPVSGGYHTTATLSVATQSGWGTPLKLGYQATDALTTLGFTYLDTNTYNNTTPSGGGGGGGGGGGCPTVDMWVADNTQVIDCVVGTPLDALCGEPLEYTEGLPTTESAGIQWLAYSIENCYRLVAANGAEVIVSESTPVPTLETIEALAELGDKLGYKPAILASEVHAGLHAITNVGNGPEWSQLVSTECVGLRHVARLYCGGRNFAAGVVPGKYIYTHNAPNIVK